MKKFSVSLIVVVIALSMAMSFVACNKQQTNVETGSIKHLTFVFLDENNTVIKELSDQTECKFYADWLNELQAEGKISFKYDNGDYGMFITEIENQVAPNGYYIGIWCSDSSEEVTSTAYGSVQYKGKTYGTCNDGATKVELKDNYIYGIAFIEYSW